MAPKDLVRSRVVVLLGPDGSGKSSVVKQLERDLPGYFSDVRVHHLRPRIGTKSMGAGGIVENPHGLPPRSTMMSMAKLLYLIGDYSLIYLWKLQIKTQRTSTLILFDRYYHDLLVDPRRYRYGAPMWMARFAACFVPRPDLWILLDAPAEVIQSRKREVSREETLRQRQAYLELVRHQRNGHVVDASQPLAEVISSVARLIVGGGARS